MNKGQQIQMFPAQSCNMKLATVFHTMQSCQEYTDVVSAGTKY